jgi:hypothetical protein
LVVRVYRIRRGQANLISEVLLVSAALVIGISLAAYAAAVMGQANTERQLNDVLQYETSVTIIYKEFDPGNNTVYLGIIRIDASPGTYYYVVINGSGEDCNSLNVFNDAVSESGVPADKVFFLDESGGYFPLSSFLGGGARIPLKVVKVPSGGNPYLLKVQFSEDSRCRVVVFFSRIGDNYYEVGRYVSKA